MTLETFEQTMISKSSQEVKNQALHDMVPKLIKLARAAKKLIDTQANLTVTGFDPTYWVDSHELLRREVEEVFGNDA